MAIIESDVRTFQIYILVDLDDDTYYVGSAWAVLAVDRFKLHMKQKGGARLVNERVALGHQFKQNILENGVGGWGDALDKEEYWIQLLRKTDPRYNLNLNLTPSRGPRSIAPMSDETKRKISVANSISHKGVPRPDLAEMYRGKPRLGGTPWLIGRAPSNKGKKSPKISAAKMGHSVSAETRQKISDTHKGIPLGPFSEEHLLHLREAAQREPIRIYRCGECEMETLAPSMGRHHKKTRHVGKSLINEMSLNDYRRLMELNK